ncbi:MAG: trypsin-like peptidase domain-containing protein [Candidatus Omnitrophota bacterium]|nr:MAG: trypsin-like peptidase domain-containing protein [Candidatus Omnitrophota bacterium]
MENKEYFCDRSLKPWVITLIVLTVLLVIWIVIKKEEIMLVREREDIRSTINSVVSPTGGMFSKPLQSAALTTLSPSKNYDIAAITKATPKGGIQLVAKPSYLGFQNALKDAVNTIIPSVCDIHARWIRRFKSVQRPLHSQNLQFLPPFDGVIDKFIQNRGYENIGAGILVDQRGYLLTNLHVVKDATDLIVTIPSNPLKDFKATVAAYDIKNDLALLKLKTEGTFLEAKLGDSSFCQIGDYIIAVGSPFGMEQTVTSGIISGIRRSVRIGSIRYENLFQTDAPINRGSSGGPLVNLKGEVIGINTAIYAPTGVFSGTGFAIPINDVKEFLSSALGRNYPVALDRRGMFAVAINNPNLAVGWPLPVRFGIEAISVNSVVASQLGLKEIRGVLVNRVFADSPASFAGIQRGDIITSIAGVPINNMRDIPKIVSHFKKGDNVNVRITRNGKTDEMLIRLR